MVDNSTVKKLPPETDTLSLEVLASEARQFQGKSGGQRRKSRSVGVGYVKVRYRGGRPYYYLRERYYDKDGKRKIKETYLGTQLPKVP